MEDKLRSDPATVELEIIKPADEAPIFTELVAELGHDPLDRMHSSYDDLHVASQMHTEAMEHLRKLVHNPTE